MRHSGRVLATAALAAAAPRRARAHAHRQPRRMASAGASPAGVELAASPSSAVAAALHAWTPLGVPPAELRLDVTLPTGQTFRWRRTRDGEYTGVVGTRVFALRQTADDVLYRHVSLRPLAASADGAGVAAALPPPLPALDAAAEAAAAAAALRDYLALSVPLAPLHAHFCAADPARFALLQPYVLGARVLRQPPAECLFAFICSSNNHVNRIAGMVERLCASYGTCLGVPASDGAVADATAQQQPLLPFYAFPTAAQLAAAEEEALRRLGFGYRAKYIVGTAAALAARPGGGDAWLASLRSGDVSPSAATSALRCLPGVGPKVAACVALFSLDKHSLIPVDTHVWQLALAHYLPELRGEPGAPPPTLTPKTMAAVEAGLAARFGPYAGWAQTALFVAELRQQRDKLPDALRTPPGGTPAAAQRARKKAAAAAAEAEAAAAGDGGNDAAADVAGDTPRRAKKARPTKRQLHPAAAPAETLKAEQAPAADAAAAPAADA